MTSESGLAPVAGSDKRAWRAWARNQRAMLPTEEISEGIVRHLSERLAGADALTVLLYLPFGSEVDLRALTAASAPTAHHRYAVTRTPDAGPLAAGKLAEPLTIHSLESPMERHRFGMIQPVADAQRTPFDEVDIVLVPGLAFDRRGTRLGFGAGYFDRLLPEMPSSHVIGVVPNHLLVDRLPVESHDHPMSELVTEQGFSSPNHC